MGRKAKIGKQRKDRYYHLAKETGYRSRSAFKLIQLNRKFSFLQSSRVLIDLCAAPGGWLQVASRNMPVSSMIIGVDLFPIKPIPNVTSFTCDITTMKCRMLLRKEMKTWKADCVLHDGAPNVGASWLLDAFSQAQLTLHALKLACEFLNKGGWFVTKVFRSKDYQPLLWVFHQMFRKVHVTKPQASRNESAEIFVVCQSYIAPDKIDAKFFDPKYIFKDVVSEETKQKATILRDPAKVKKAKAEGYREGDYTLYHPVPVGEFMRSEDPLEVLNGCSEIVLDDPSIASHPLTSAEIKLCCQDIKVLGRREVRSLLAWHKKYNQERSKEEEEAKEQEGKQVEDKTKKDSDSESEDEDDEVAKQLAEVREEERLTERRKKKDSLKKRKKLRERLHKSKELQSTMGDDTQGESLFGLVAIKNTKQLQELNTDDASTVANDNSQPREKQKKQLPSLKPAKTARVDEEEEEEEESDDSMIDSELDEDEASALRAEIEKAHDRYDTSDDQSDSDAGMSDDDEPAGNPLVVDLDQEDPEEGTRRRTKLWFRKGVFDGIEDEEDEDMEISEATKTYQQQGGTVIERRKKRQMPDDDDDEVDSKKKRSVRFNTTVTSLDDEGDEEEDALTSDSEDDDDNTRTRGGGQKGQRSSLSGGVPNSKAGSTSYDSSDSDSDSDYDDEIMMKKDLDDDEEDVDEGNDVGTKGKGKKGDKNSKEEPGASSNKKAKLPSLDPEGLAIGTLMATSKKATREIIEHGYHRYSYGDGDRLPDWLRQDEAKHCRRKMPVSKELVGEYRARLREINARPIKKIAEAKARKKKRQVARMEKLRKKAEAISDMADTSEVEKMQQIRNLYKKYKLGSKKKDVTYVVTRKHQASKRVSRPKGVKGPFKVVDPRMKKDMRGMKRADQRKKNRRKR